MRGKLDEDQLKIALAKLPEWKLQQSALTRDVVFDDFRRAIEFVNKLAIIAEEANHHPDIDIRYKHVRLSLTTHDAGGITQKDIELSEQIDSVLAE